MSETASLVTWNAPENLGKVPGSDWMCPLDDVARLSFYEKRGGTVDDEAIKRLAGGRSQYLELLQYPEGYHTLQMVDGETGAILLDENASRRYSGYVGHRHDSKISYHTKPGTLFAIGPGDPLILDDGRYLTSFSYTDSTTRTAIYPRPIDASETDADARHFGNTTLLPEAKTIYVSLRCRAGSFDGTVNVHMQEYPDIGPSATISILANNPDTRFEQVNLRVDAEGQLKGVDSDFNKKFLERLGVDTSKMTWAEKSGNGTVVDPEQQKIAADSLAEILGMSSWEGIDLRMTASGLYAALGQRYPDFNSIVVPLAGKRS